MRTRGRPLVLDTNCFVNAAANDREGAAYEEFCSWAAPRLFLSTVVGAELRAGLADITSRRTLESRVLAPYLRRGRIVNPSRSAWDALGTTLAALSEAEGLSPRHVRRSFIFDILIARSCREIGAVLVTGNTKDMIRIAQVFPFEFVQPYPPRGTI